MNRKILIYISLTIFSVFLFAKLALAEEASDNAATYYNKAFELCTLSYQDPIFKKVTEVVKNGWVAEDKELEALLKQNAPAIAEFEKGVKLEKCDFAFGKAYDNPYTQPIPNLLKARTLSNLILLTGRWHEKQRDYAKAIKWYLVTLTFAQHISQDKQLVSVMIAIAIEGLALCPLQQYVEKKQIDSKLCRKIVIFLQNKLSKRSTLAEAMKKEEEGYLWAGRTSILELQKKIKQDADKVNQDRLAKGDALVEELSESFRSVADRYYSALIQAAKTNLETDVKYLEDEIEFLTKKYSAPEKRPLEKIAEAISLLKKAPDRRRKEIANMIAELLVVISLPNVLRAGESYYTSEAKFKIIEAGAAIRIYLAEKHKLPEALSDLVPDYLARVPIDPWSQRPLRYVKTDKKFIVYSLGPDRTDNNGVGTGAETSILELASKDIVFSASISGQ